MLIKTTGIIPVRAYSQHSDIIGTRAKAAAFSRDRIAVIRVSDDGTANISVISAENLGLLEIAVRDGSAAERLGADIGQPVWLAPKG